MFSVVTDRYNNETWEASLRYRKKHNFTCIYAPPHKLKDTININSPVFVIEMNNETNQIMGIGLIKNKLVTNKVYKVQEDTNHNRYIYIGEHHISRELLDMYNPFLVFVLDNILFKGYTHSKRGSGLTLIPEKILKMDICEGINIKNEIKKIFIYHYRENISRKKLENKVVNN